jgi:apolipoprotein N-acyltransferase
VLLTAALASAIALHAGKLHHPAGFATSDGATLVQADIPILSPGEWTGDYLNRTLDSLQGLSVRPQNNKPDTPGLIIWPESPAPFFATDLHVRSKLAGIARATDSYIIAGSLGIEHAGEVSRQPDIYNSASVVAPNGAWTERYDKIHLVPFGEYVPFAKLFSFAAGLTRQIGTFARGKSRMPLYIGDAQAGVFICYESVFPNEVRQFAKNGAELFVNISNDGWYGHGGAQRQHLNMARMRAVENNRWLLRDTNTGITAVIDPYGRVVAEAPRDQRTNLQAAYSLEESMTFYTRHGDWFPFLCAIITVGGLLLRYFGRTEAALPG